MATISPVSLQEYLQTSYRPDREYMDGELRERNVGKFEQARMQALLVVWFGNHERDWGTIVVTEQRIQVRPGRIRIPDVAVLLRGSHPDILVDPPLLIVEILSPDDTFSDTQERARDYQDMGVETVWIIDPKTRSGRICTGAQWTESNLLSVAGTPLYLELDQIFSQI